MRAGRQLVRALGKSSRGDSKGIQLPGEAFLAAQLGALGGEQRRGEMPGVAAGIDLEDIKLAGSGLADDIAAQKRYAGKGLCGPAREIHDFLIDDESAQALVADLCLSIGMLGFDDRLFDQLVGRIQRRTLDAARLAKAVERLAQQGQYAPAARQQAGIDEALQEKPRCAQRMVLGILAAVEGSQATGPLQAHQPALAHFAEIDRLQDGEFAELLLAVLHLRREVRGAWRRHAGEAELDVLLVFMNGAVLQHQATGRLEGARIAEGNHQGGIAPVLLGDDARRLFHRHDEGVDPAVFRRDPCRDFVKIGGIQVSLVGDKDQVLAHGVLSLVAARVSCSGSANIMPGINSPQARSKVGSG